MSPRVRRWGHASLKVLGFSALLSVGALGAAQAVNAPPAAVPPAWVVYFLAGAACLLFIIKEGRALLGFPPKRAHEEDLMKQLRDISESLTGMGSAITALEEGRDQHAAEIARLRDARDGLDERISAAMSKVASQMQTTLATVQERNLATFADLRDRIALVSERIEQGRRR